MRHKSVACLIGRRPSRGGSCKWLGCGIRPVRVIRTVACMTPSLVFDSLTKRFGSVTAVDALSFTAPAGCVTGLVGPNGSGKSTTMRAALGLVHPTRGGVRIDGMRYADLRRPLAHVGAVLDAGAVNGGLSGRAHLRWMCRSNAISTSGIDPLLDRVGLAGVARRRVTTYSLGMKQRLGIAAALLGDPAILIFDEPMNGLDPEGMVWLRALLRTQADEGRIVLLSSHLMRELEGIADRLVIIDDGRLVDDTTVAELLADGGDAPVTVRTTQRVDMMAVLANAGASVTSTDRDTIEVRGLPVDRIAQLVAAHGLALHALHTAPRSLEEIYLQRTNRERNPR
jgi:ABC-2 type transport system ATP-binding protein